jgi:WD40 repeat protein/uncharacterized protein YegL
MKKFLLLVLFLISSHAFSQSLSLFDVDASNFPTIRAKFYAFDAQGNQQRPNISDLSLTENGIPRTITNVSCPAPKPPKALSSVLVIDVSGSMGQKIGSEINLDIAKAGANRWVNLLPLGSSECAIVSFDGYNYLNQDFTTDKSKLLNKISKILPNGSTDYNAAFIEEKAGGLLITKTGKFQKIIVFLTDGNADEPKTQEIINEANNQNCVIYTISLGIPATQSIKEIAKQTGGHYFEISNSIDEIENVYATILRFALSAEPCNLVWESGYSCFSNLINVSLQYNSSNNIVQYFSPINSVNKLEYEPASLRFENPIIGNTVTKQLTIKGNVLKSSAINVKSSNPLFVIEPTNFVLQPNQNQIVNISYIAIDSGYMFGRFDFENDLCNQTFYVSGGYKGIKPKVNTLRLISPNGGENFVVGMDTTIIWDGVTDDNLIKIEYSIDNGNSWIYLDTVRGLSYKWTDIPKPTSQKCLIRIKQLTTLSIDSVQTLKGHSSFVYAVKFSPDGKILASGSWDKTIKTWDPMIGNNIHTMNGHTQGIKSLSFSPDGNLLLSGGRDNKNKLWNVVTGFEVNSFSVDTTTVYSVAYSPSGNNFISGGWSHAVIYDITGSENVQIMSGHTSYINCVAYSPDGNKIATGSNDRSVIIWDAKTGILERLFWHTHAIYAVDFSPDGKILAAGGEENVIQLWDLETGNLIKTLSGHTYTINGINFSPDGKMLATGSWDKTIKLWDVESGKEIKTLYGHELAVTSIAFHPDGRKLASASTDNTVKIWNLLDNVLQSDQSDSVFSIVEPLGASTDIQMGEVLLSDSKDSVVIDFVRNVGSWNFDVRTVSFRGADAGAFSLVSGIPQYRVEPNSSHFGEFRFTPSRVGLHQAEVVIVTQSDTIVQNITGIGVDLQLQIHATFIDFGEVEVGNERTIIDTLVLKNVGANPITIDDTKLLSPDVEQFVLLSGGGNFTLGVGEERLVTIQFKPKYIGRTSGRIGFEYAGIGSPAIANLFGNGIGGLVYVPNDSGYVGDRKSIRLMLGKVKPDAIASIAPKFKATLRLHNNHLAPINKNDVSMQNDSFYINLQGSNGSTALLAEIPVLVGLGNVDFSWIDIVDFAFLDASDNPIDYDFEKQNGSFKTLGICYEGGIRLINSTTPVPLLTVSPNPSDGKVEIEVHLIEDGVSTLKIFTSNGFLMEEMKFTTSGSRTIELDTKPYSNGLYFITIETPTQFERAKLLLVK